MNRENILKVAQAIEDAAKPDANPAIGFNMATWRTTYGSLPDQTGHACDTVCCIAGWAASLAGSGAAGKSPDDIAEQYLGLEHWEALALFLPLHVTDLRGVTTAHAVAVLRNLAETRKINWQVGAPS